VESSSVNALKRSRFKSVEGNERALHQNISSKLIVLVTGFGGKLSSVEMASFFVMELTSSLIFQWHFLCWNIVAGKLGGPSAVCMPATRTADAKHLKPCFKDSPRNTAINHRPWFYTRVAWRSLQQKCVLLIFPCSSAGSLPYDWLKLIPVYMRTQLGSY